MVPAADAANIGAEGGEGARAVDADFYRLPFSASLRHSIVPTAMPADGRSPRFVRSLAARANIAVEMLTADQRTPNANPTPA